MIPGSCRFVRLAFVCAVSGLIRIRNLVHSLLAQLAVSEAAGSPGRAFLICFYFPALISTLVAMTAAVPCGPPANVTDLTPFWLMSPS